MRAFMTFLICTKLGLWRRPSQFWLILATTCLRCSSSFHLAGYSISTCRTDYANSVVVFFVYLLCAFCWYKVKTCRINQLTPIQRQIPPTDLRHTHTHHTWHFNRKSLQAIVQLVTYTLCRPYKITNMMNTHTQSCVQRVPTPLPLLTFPSRRNKTGMKMMRYHKILCWFKHRFVRPSSFI